MNAHVQVPFPKAARVTGVPGVPLRTSRRTSEVLRGILERHPDAKTFTIESILNAMGAEQAEASMLLFSVPSVLPVPGTSVLSGAPLGIASAGVAAGNRRVRLPKYLMKKAVPRKSLAVAIHAIVPVIEHVEKVLKPRWKWMSSGVSRRALGVLIFVLAAAIAFPLLGFDPFHAASIFVISLGMAEKDGMAIAVGVLAGVLLFIAP